MAKRRRRARMRAHLECARTNKTKPQRSRKTLCCAVEIVHWHGENASHVPITALGWLSPREHRPALSRQPAISPPPRPQLSSPPPPHGLLTDAAHHHQPVDALHSHCCSQHVARPALGLCCEWMDDGALSLSAAGGTDPLGTFSGGDKRWKRGERPSTEVNALQQALSSRKTARNEGGRASKQHKAPRLCPNIFK